MNQDLVKLYQIAGKKSRKIIGLMSGTSLDGLDIALCEIQNFGTSTHLSVEKFTTFPYSEKTKSAIRKVFAKGLVELPYLAALNVELGKEFAKIICNTLEEWKIQPNSIDLIASHGQTIMHVPEKIEGMGPSTLQIGDADQIAFGTGILTLSDFRQKHLAAGGQGAPLVVYGDYLLFTDPRKDQIYLNIGGIGNFTFLPKNGQSKDIKLSDTGPGNTLIDAAMIHFYQKSYDENGGIAKSGKLNEALWNYLMKHPFLKREYPKSTGPEEFNFDFLFNQLENIPAEDWIHSLSRYTVYCIEKSIKDTVNLDDCLNTELYVSGGGLKNGFLMEELKKSFASIKVVPFEKAEIPADAKEAALFALLANETIANPESSKGRKLGPFPWPYFGKISFPN